LSKDSLGTSLDKIEGIGPKTVELLISHFGSVKQVKAVKKEELVKLIGKRKAEKIIKNSQKKNRV
jgi:excinuclease ABC subunit C